MAVVKGMLSTNEEKSADKMIRISMAMTSLSDSLHDLINVDIRLPTYLSRPSSSMHFMNINKPAKNSKVPSKHLLD